MTTYNRDELRNGTLHFGTLRNKRGTALLNGTRYTGKFWGIKSELRFYPDDKALLAESAEISGPEGYLAMRPQCEGLN